MSYDIIRPARRFLINIYLVYVPWLMQDGIIYFEPNMDSI